MRYGDKRDYPKIQICLRWGKKGNYFYTYLCSTTWSKTCKEAKAKYLQAHPEYKASEIKCNFDK